MPDTTPNLVLPYIAAAQAQKHVTHNEAIRALDALLQIVVADRDLTAPPEVSVDGERYIVATPAIGVWVGQDNTLAAYQDGAWVFYPPRKGWLAWVADENVLIVWNGAAWTDIASAAPLEEVALFGVNTAADATNRLAIKSDAVLHSHDDATPGSGDVRHVLNKNQPLNTASLIFQSAFSGRAEVGTVGDDNFHVKVSPDGSTWHEAIVVNGDNGSVSFPNSALAGAGAIAIESEGVEVAAAVQRIDFTGGGVTVSLTEPGTVTVTIPGAGAPGNAQATARRAGQAPAKPKA